MPLLSTYIKKVHYNKPRIKRSPPLTVTINPGLPFLDIFRTNMFNWICRTYLVFLSFDKIRKFLAILLQEFLDAVDGGSGPHSLPMAVSSPRYVPSVSSSGGRLLRGPREVSPRRPMTLDVPSPGGAPSGSTGPPSPSCSTSPLPPNSK